MSQGGTNHETVFLSIRFIICVLDLFFLCFRPTALTQAVLGLRRQHSTTRVSQNVHLPYNYLQCSHLFMTTAFPYSPESTNKLVKVVNIKSAKDCYGLNRLEYFLRGSVPNAATLSVSCKQYPVTSIILGTLVTSAALIA